MRCDIVNVFNTAADVCMTAIENASSGGTEANAILTQTMTLLSSTMHRTKATTFAKLAETLLTMYTLNVATVSRALIIVYG